MPVDVGFDGAGVTAARPLPVDIGENVTVEVGATVEVTNDTGNPLPVVGQLVRVAAEFTRPADTTAYAAKDAVGDSTSAPTVITLTDAARANGKGGYIVKLALRTNKSTITPRFKVHLFHTSPAAINDNAAFTLLWANRALRIGGFELAAMSTEGAGSDMATAHDLTVRIPFVAAAASRNIFALLETLDAFTPDSGQVFRLELVIDQT